MRFGTSGIRGIYGKDITEKKVFDAMAKHAPDVVVVSNDARPASLSLKHAAISSLLRSGSHVVDIGMNPTGAVAYFSRKTRSHGIQFTASHNPPEYAGMKFFSPAGRGMTSMPGHSASGKPMFRTADIRSSYYKDADKFLKLFKPSEKVLIDPGNGSASGFFNDYFISRGMRFDSINDFPDAINPNRPLEPKPDTIKGSIKYIRSSDCGIGAAFDGDADRVVFFDSEGFLGFNEMIAIISSEYVRRTNASRKVVTTIESGLMFDQLLDGFKITRTNVGDINVANRLPDYGAIGVEQPGHYMFWDFYPAPDVLVPVLIASSIGHEKIRDIIDSAEKTYFMKESLKSDDKQALVEKFKQHVDEFDWEKKRESDGIWLKGRDWIILVRASGTENVVRISVDSYSRSQSEQLIGMIKEVLFS